MLILGDRFNFCLLLKASSSFSSASIMDSSVTPGNVPSAFRSGGDEGLLSSADRYFPPTNVTFGENRFALRGIPASPVTREVSGDFSSNLLLTEAFDAIKSSRCACRCGCSSILFMDGRWEGSISSIFEISS